MAKQHGDVHYTLWAHVENGKPMTRRLHRLEIQARDGRLYVLTGKDLPDFIQTCTGTGHKGEHLAQILLNPEQVKPAYMPPSCRPWPAGRDVFHVIIGLCAVILLRFLASIITHCL